VKRVDALRHVRSTRHVTESSTVSPVVIINQRLLMEMNINYVMNGYDKVGRA